MFEPKSYVEKRLVLVEALISQLLGSSIQKAIAGSDEAEMLQKLSSNWQYHGHNIKVEEAKRVLGAPFPITEETATRPWIANIMRHNLGLLEVFGDGEYNPAPELPGNSDLAFTQWLHALEDPNQVVRDTRPSEFFKDSMHLMGGLPVLKILTTDDKGRNFIHLIILFSGLTVQSLSLDHLPPKWDWDTVPDAWRAEMFSYLDNMSKRNFMLEFARAIQTSRGEAWGDEPAVLYVPEDDGVAIDLAREVTQQLGMTFKAIKTQVAVVPDEPSFEGVAEGFENAVAANEDQLHDSIPPDLSVARVVLSSQGEGRYRVYVPAFEPTDVLSLVGGGPESTLDGLAVYQTLEDDVYGTEVAEIYHPVPALGGQGVFALNNATNDINVTVDRDSGVVTVSSDRSGLARIGGVVLDIQLGNRATAEVEAVENDSKVVEQNEDRSQFRIYLEIDKAVDIAKLIGQAEDSAAEILSVEPYAIQYAGTERAVSAMFREDSNSSAEDRRWSLTNSDRSVRLAASAGVGTIRATSVESQVRGVYINVTMGVPEGELSRGFPLINLPWEGSTLVMPDDAPRKTVVFNGIEYHAHAWPVGRQVDLLGATQHADLISQGVIDQTDHMKLEAITDLLLQDKDGTYSTVPVTDGKFIVGPNANYDEIVASFTQDGISVSAEAHREWGSIQVKAEAGDGVEVIGYWIDGYRANNNRREAYSKIRPESEADTNSA